MIRITLLAFAFLTFLAGCNPTVISEDPFSGTEIHQTPVRVIFDTDISGDWDDVAATAMLLELANSGEAEILAMGVSAGGYAARWSPACLDALNTYYGLPDIPIGVVKRDIGSTYSAYAKEIAEEWPHDLTSDDVWDATELYRKILSEQPDTSVVMISVGYLSNMSDLLKSKPDKYSKLDGLALVAKKVNRWVCMGGEFPEGAESNLRSLPLDTKFAIENWPRPILFSGIKIGSAIRTGHGLARASYDNPVRRAYEICCGHVGCTHANWDQTAVLAAVRNPQLYWDVESGGSCAIVDEHGSNKWIRGKGGNHGYLVIKGNEEEISKTIDDLMTDVPHPNVDENKLVAYWKFDENATDILQDASGNGHTGVFIGSHSWVKGKYGQAACFGTGSRYMFVDKSRVFLFPDRRFSIAFWVYFQGEVPAERSTLIMHDVAVGRWMGVYKTAGTNSVGFMVKKDSIQGTMELEPDTWHHITVSLAHDTASIYIDGSLDVKAQIDISELYYLGHNGFQIGANVTGENQSETYIDDLFIIGDALSNKEINAIMNNQDSYGGN